MTNHRHGIPGSGGTCPMDSIGKVCNLGQYGQYAGLQAHVIHKNAIRIDPGSGGHAIHWYNEKSPIFITLNEKPFPNSLLLLPLFWHACTFGMICTPLPTVERILSRIVIISELRIATRWLCSTLPSRDNAQRGLC